MRTFCLMRYKCSRSTSLDSFFYDTSAKKAIQKNYVTLTSTCISKGVFICVSELLNALVRIGD